MLFMLLASNVHAAVLPCPPAKEGRKLVGLSVFDGDPIGKVDLKPDSPVFVSRRNYTNAWDFPTGAAGLTMVCRFEADVSTIFNLDKTFKGCQSKSTNGVITGSCF